jgi:toxin YoeB
MSLYTIEFTQIAIKAVSKYKKSNPVHYRKLVKLLNELMEHPRTGTGQYWS